LTKTQLEAARPSSLDLCATRQPLSPRSSNQPDHYPVPVDALHRPHQLGGGIGARSGRVLAGFHQRPRRVRIWDPATGAAGHTPEGHTGQGDGVGGTSLHRPGRVHPPRCELVISKTRGWLVGDRGNAPGAWPTGAAIIAAETTYPYSAWCCVVWLASSQRSGRLLRGPGYRHSR
jgi:hypothetical protein